MRRLVSNSPPAVAFRSRYAGAGRFDKISR